MDGQKLCGLYGLSPLQDILPIQPGTTARVWRMTTGDGDFLVRTLSGPGQGEREWAIFRHLTDQGFAQTPAILPTLDGAPAAELDGVWYQLQRFRPGARPDPAAPGVPRALARLSLRLAGALAHCPAVDAEPFSLEEVWDRARCGWSQLSLPFSLAQADRAVERCAALPERERQVIHGDLGPWNLLQTPEGELLVIDFGQARMGDPYFDLASLLAGMVNHTPPARREAVCGEFLAVYRRHAPLDRPRLLEQLALWAWRGLARCAQAGPGWAQMAGRFWNGLHWLEEHL